MLYAITDNARLTPVEGATFSNNDIKPGVLVAWPTFPTKEEPITIGRFTHTPSRELGLLFGLFIGDGWADKSHGKIHIASICSTVRDTFLSLANTYLRDTPTAGYTIGNTEHYFDGYKSTHGKMSVSLHAPERLSMLEMFNHGAHNKTFPEYFLYQPEEFRWGLLSGLIDTDGSVSYKDNVKKKNRIGQNKHATYTTQSWDLARKVQLLCMSLDINASISVAFRKGRYEVIVNLSTLELYNNRHGLRCLTDKRDIIDKFVVTDIVNAKDIIPFNQKYIDLYPKPRYSLIFKARKDGYITRESFYKYSPDEVIRIAEEEYNLNTRWERVLRIVYLPDYHSNEDVLKEVMETRHANRKNA